MSSTRLKRLFWDGVVFLVINVVAGESELSAQRPESSFPHPKAGVTYENFPHDLIGNWKPFPQGNNCGSLKDERGNKLGICQYPVAELEKLMNDRARAWIKFFDEPMSSKWSCVSGNVTTELGDIYMWNFSATEDRITQVFEQSNTPREIWIDGRPHPPATLVFYQGHAIGWMDGDASGMIRAGWKNGTLPVGTLVKVEGHPSRTEGAKALLAGKVTTPGGKVFNFSAGSGPVDE